MGATATGKTDIAVELYKRFPSDIISVDSALVYRGMNIGTAKPNPEVLQQAPHQLVDIREPEDSYSAGDFVRDARAAIEASFAANRVPLLVGGTMMYFRALTKGLADLPVSDDDIRKQIDQEASAEGWPALHAKLAVADRDAAARINPNDSQRIQRALEVFRVSGKSLSDWQRDARQQDDDIEHIKIALSVEPRNLLHERIDQRIDAMIQAGLADELRTLMSRPALTQDSSSMRSVGYRQFWKYIDGEYPFDEARDRTLFATRQLAKRQLTWLRSEQGAFAVDALEADAIDSISTYLARRLD